MGEVNKILARASLLLLLAAAGPTIYGQGTTTPGTRGRVDPVQLEMQRRFEAEAIEKVLAARPRPPSAHESRLLLDQIRKDFLRIQVLDDGLKAQTVRTGNVDFSLVAKSASEIRRCADRLKDNLSLPKVESTRWNANGNPETDERLRLLIDSLSKSIKAFVANPVFESARVVNPDQSTQASRDLEQIILKAKETKKLSERLRRGP